MKWHRFGQEENEPFDKEAWHWTDVMPGDVVQSKGTHAYRQRDFIGRTDLTHTLHLKYAPVLVLSKHFGIPGEEPPESGYVTFVCLSRHGLIIVVNTVKNDKD